MNNSTDAPRWLREVVFGCLDITIFLLALMLLNIAVLVPINTLVPVLDIFSPTTVVLLELSFLLVASITITALLRCRFRKLTGTRKDFVQVLGASLLLLAVETGILYLITGLM